MSHRSIGSPFWLIILCAFLLRLASINQSGYWYDEMLTLQNSPLAWPQMLESLKYTESNKPPFYYLFMQEWMKGGTSETWMRLPSAFFGALTCGFFFLIGQRLLGRPAGWLMAAYLALSPFHLGYSDEARMYALFGLETSAALLCLILFFQERKTRHLIGFGLLSVLATYTFPYGFFFIGLGGLLLLVQWKKMGTARSLGLLMTLAVSFALFLPWLARMMQASNSAEGTQYYKGPPWSALAYTFYSLGFGFDLGPTINNLQTMGAHYFPAHPGQTVLTMAAFATLVVIVGRGLWELRHDRFLLTLGLGGLFIFLCGPAIISLIKPTITDNPRYAFLSIIPFGLLMTVGLRALWQEGPLRRSVVMLFGAFLALSLFHWYFSPEYQREDIRGATAFVAQQPVQPKIIVICTNYLDIVAAHYYHGPAEILGFTTHPNKFDEESRKLSDRLDKVDRFAVIYARPDHGDRERKFIPWLQNRYHLVEQTAFPGTEVYLFSK